MFEDQGSLLIYIFWINYTLPYHAIFVDVDISFITGSFGCQAYDLSDASFHFEIVASLNYDELC